MTSAIFMCLLRQVTAIMVWLYFRFYFSSGFTVVHIKYHHGFILWDVRFYISPPEDSSFPDVTPKLLVSLLHFCHTMTK